MVALAEQFLEVAPATDLQVVLEVLHHGQDKMVGKVVMLPHLPKNALGAQVPLAGVPKGKARVAAFLHEESGSQPHVQLDSPGGVDTVVVQYLLAHGVSLVVHVRRGSRFVLVSTPRRIAEYGAPATYDGRARLYLPWSAWAVVSPWWKTLPWVKAVVTLPAE